MLLPILAIERLQHHLWWEGFQTAQVNAESIGVGTGDVKRFHATLLAESVLGHASIESIGGDGVLALQQPEAGLGHDNMLKSQFIAHGAITFLHSNRIWQHAFGFYCTAVAAGNIRFFHS